jgi:acetolactate synthase small subunit
MTLSQTDANFQFINKIRGHLRITYKVCDTTETDILARKLGFINSAGQPTKLGKRLVNIFDQSNKSSEL